MLYFLNDNVRNYNSDMPFHKYTMKNVWHDKFFLTNKTCANIKAED